MCLFDSVKIMSTDASSSQLSLSLNGQQPTKKASSKDDEICDDWEQLDQIVSVLSLLTLILNNISFIFPFKSK